MDQKETMTEKAVAEAVKEAVRVEETSGAKTNLQQRLMRLMEQ
jgi:hypothetical protein